MFREGINFFTRHSKKFKSGKGLTESTDYRGLTDPEGVELAQKTTREQLKPMIDKLPKNAVMVIIGASEAVRTKSTARVYGNELNNLYRKNEQVIVKTREDIADPKTGYTNVIEKLTGEINNHPDKKFVVDFPLAIKEFSMTNRWVDKKGNQTPYCDKLLESVKDDDDLAVLKWVESNGEIDGMNYPAASGRGIHPDLDGF